MKILFSILLIGIMSLLNAYQHKEGTCGFYKDKFYENALNISKYSSYYEEGKDLSFFKDSQIEFINTLFKRSCQNLPKLKDKLIEKNCLEKTRKEFENFSSFENMENSFNLRNETCNENKNKNLEKEN